MSSDNQTIEIIDAHIHYWDPYTTPRSVSDAVKYFSRFPKLMDWVIRMAMPKATTNYFGDTTLFTTPYLPHIHLGSTGKYTVKGVVHIQADWQAKGPTDYAQETAWLNNLDTPPLAIIGEARLNDLANLDALLDAHTAASPRFRGIRDMLAYHQADSIHSFNEREDMMTTAAFRQGYTRIGERGLTYDAFLFSHQLPMLCDLVEAIPSTNVVLDHVGTPIGLGGPYAEFGSGPAERRQVRAAWRTNMKRLAQSEQVYVKLSGLFMHVLGWQHSDRWLSPISTERAVELISEHIHFVIETFGAERCIFASNFPPDLGLIDFETLYDAFFMITEGFDHDTKQALFAGNARRFYNITE